jgi:hypothetical protein
MMTKKSSKAARRLAGRFTETVEKWQSTFSRRRGLPQRIVVIQKSSTRTFEGRSVFLRRNVAGGGMIDCLSRLRGAKPLRGFFDKLS